MKGKEKQKRIRNPKNRQSLLGTMRTALILLGVAVIIIILVLVLRPSSQFINSPEIQRTRTIGVLRVGVLTDKKGFSQNYQGLEVDLARALSTRLFTDQDPDAMMELVPVNYFTALPKLDNESIDVAIAMQVNTGSEDYAYSTPYFSNPIYLLCRPGDENTALENQNIGMYEGASSDITNASAEKLALLAYNKKNKTELTYMALPSYADMCLALINGKVDFVAIPGDVAMDYLDWNIAKHNEVLGAAEYVAVSSSMRPSYALLMGLIIEEMQKDGTLNLLIEKHGLTQM